MNRILTAAAVGLVSCAATAVPVHAAAVVAVNTPAGIYAPVDVTLDAAGTITVNTAALNTTGNYVTAGPCTITATAGFNGVPGRVNGAVCAGPGSVHFTTTGQLATTCPYDGGTLQGTRLTVAVDGAVVYDAELWPNPTTCYVTPAAQATTVWTPGTLTFINNQPRPSASTTFRLADPAWNYSAHTFTVPAGVICDRNLVDINPSRWIITLAERGFKCSGVIPANTTTMVTVV